MTDIENKPVRFRMIAEMLIGLFFQHFTEKVLLIAALDIFVLLRFVHLGQ